MVNHLDPVLTIVEIYCKTLTLLFNIMYSNLEALYTYLNNVPSYTNLYEATKRNPQQLAYSGTQFDSSIVYIFVTFALRILLFLFGFVSWIVNT